MIQSDDETILETREMERATAEDTEGTAYLQLGNSEGHEIEEQLATQPLISSRRKKLWRLTVISLLIVLSIAAGVALVIWVLPLILDKAIIPLLIWEASSFSRPVLALVLILSLAIFPIILIPSGPSMWLSGMIFGYIIGFVIIFTGTTIGQTLAYFVGHWLFHARIQIWLQKWPKRAVVLRLAEQGEWFHQFRTIILLRFSPIPYTIFNYLVCATNIKYSPYIFGSLIGMIPEALITIYSGRLLRTLAEMKHTKRRLTPVQIIYNILGFSIATVVLITGTVYARRALRELEEKGATEGYEATNNGWQEDLRSISSVQLLHVKPSDSQTGTLHHLSSSDQETQTIG